MPFPNRSRNIGNGDARIIMITEREEKEEKE